MCRYATKAYKPHFACFTCRKIFRKTAFADYLKQMGVPNAYQVLRPRFIDKENPADSQLRNRIDQLHDAYKKTLNTCPECGQTMAGVGLDLKAPRKTDVKAWRLLEGMYRTGHYFHSCGCDGIGFVPKSTSDYKAYLYRRLADYQEHLDRISNEFRGDQATKQDSQLYWAEKIARIKREIELVD